MENHSKRLVVWLGTSLLGGAAADGDPISGAGSLQVTVGFTDFDQDVDAIVNLAPPGADLSGRTLHALVRRVSGSFSGNIQFHASAGPSFVFAGTFLDASSFPLGEWVPMTLDLNAATGAGFDPSQVVQIGVQFVSGFSSGGGAFTPGGDAVFQIDSVSQ